MDFFNVSGSRDLFFHVQEHQLELPQIKAFLDDRGLDFLGFVLAAQKLQKFYAQFPAESSARDLDLWQTFERVAARPFGAKTVTALLVWQTGETQAFRYLV